MDDVHWINQLHPVHNAMGFPDSHPMDSDLFSGQHYSVFSLRILVEGERSNVTREYFE